MDLIPEQLGEDQRRDEEELTAVELLLYRHFRHLACPAPVDPVDTEDCASMAVEVVRFLTEKGVIQDREAAYRAGREDAARELGVTCQDELQEAFGSHGHECSRERDHRSGKHRCDCGVEWWATEGPVIGYLVKGRRGDDDIVLDPADVTIVRSPERPVCTCPDCDVTTFKELPGSRTVKGYDARCPVHGPAISLGRSEQGDGDSPEEQRPPSKDQGRSEPSWSRVCGPHCIDGYCCDHAEEQR